MKSEHSKSGIFDGRISFKWSSFQNTICKPTSFWLYKIQIPAVKHPSVVYLKNLFHRMPSAPWLKERERNNFFRLDRPRSPWCCRIDNSSKCNQEWLNWLNIGKIRPDTRNLSRLRLEDNHCSHRKFCLQKLFRLATTVGIWIPY